MTFLTILVSTGLAIRGAGLTMTGAGFTRRAGTALIGAAINGSLTTAGAAINFSGAKSGAGARRGSCWTVGKIGAFAKNAGPGPGRACASNGADGAAFKIRAGAGAKTGAGTGAGAKIRAGAGAKTGAGAGAKIGAGAGANNGAGAGAKTGAGAGAKTGAAGTTGVAIAWSTVWAEYELATGAMIILLGAGTKFPKVVPINAQTRSVTWKQLIEINK